MSTPSTIPPPPAAPPPQPFSLTAYRRHNDALEAKYGPTSRSMSRPIAQAKEHLRRSLRAGGRVPVAVDEVQSCLASVLEALESRGRQ
jgi:hypothetical protein